MRIAYLGSGEFGIDCLNAVKKSNHDLVLVVSQTPKLSGRGKKQTPTPVSKWAASNSIDLIETSHVNEPEIVKEISSYKPDLILVIAFGQKVGPELVNLPAKGAINVHSSLLPKYRGAAPINWVIIDGEKETGISIITLSDKIDAGEILSQSKMPISENETAGSLHNKLAQSAAPLLLETLDKIEKGTAIYVEQDDSKVTFARKFTKSDGHLDFSEPADVLERKIRGLWPWPGASANYVSKENNKSIRVTFALTQIIENKNLNGLKAGTLDDNLNIICGQNALKVLQIKPSGSAVMNYKDFINGRRTKPGDYFSTI